jgi:hypothetical protein
MSYYPRIKFSVLLMRAGLLVLFIAVFACGARAQNTVRTGVTGVISDGKETLPGATISVLETQQVVTSGNDGTYTIYIKPGDYTLEFRFVGYKTTTKRVTIGPNQMVKIPVALGTEQKMLGAVNVTATRKATSPKALLQLRRQSANIQDAIGAEQIDKSASITTAQALQRVTGVTVKDGKYITVRGLSDRNVVVQLNGSRLAGADASRSSVAVDLIPAQLLENIIVEKSITPDKPGDANGAVVEINTKSIPDSKFMFISAQTGFNGNVGVFGYGNSFQDGNMGFFGQNVKSQNLTSAYTNLVNEFTARGYSEASGTLGQGFAQAIESSSIDQAHYNEAIKINNVMEQGFSPYLTTKAKVYDPDQIYGVTYGNRYTLKSGKVIGLILGVNYYNRSQSDPNGQDNLYTVKEPTQDGTGAPNIVYPNEFRLIPVYNLSENTGNQQLNYGGLATVSFRFNKFNELSFTYNGNFGTEVTASQENGTTNPDLKVADPTVIPVFGDHQGIYDFILHSTQRSLNSFQLHGDHKFELAKKIRPWELSYSLSTSYASQDDPDYRDTRMRVDSLGRIPNPALASGTGSTAQLIPSEYQRTYFVESDRYYRNLDEHNSNYKADLIIPFKISRDTTSIFKMGGYYYGRKRSYTETLFTRTDNSTAVLNQYGGYSQTPGDLTTLGGNLNAWSGPGEVGVIENANTLQGQSLVPGYLYTPQAGVTVIPGSNQVFINSYNATEAVTAFYGMFDLNLSKDWRVVGGLRVENTSFQSTPDTTNSNFSKISGIKDQEDFDRNYKTDYLTYNWLPSGSVIYKGLKDFNFRVAYSKTLIRPEMNEIVLSAQRDPIQQLTIYGNKNLQNGIYSNYDFRTDWFIGDDELISASAFYKTVVDQIERVYTNGTIDQYGFVNSYVTFRNNPSLGKVWGMEFEIRKNLSQFFDLGKYIYLGGNLMLARSRTTIDSVEYYTISLLERNAPDTRPLVDQPNIAYNINLDFDYPKWGTQFDLLYNKTGKRLSDINSDGTPNIYELPAPSFDVVWSQRINKRLEFKAFIKNAFNSETRFYYANPGSSNEVGVTDQEYLRRAYNYGSVYTLGFKYTF